MILKKPDPHVIRGQNRFSDKITLETKNPGHGPIQLNWIVAV